MKILSVATLVLLLASVAPARAEEYTGTWMIEQSLQPASVQLELRYQRTLATGNLEWDESRSVLLSELQGLSKEDLNSSGQHKSFGVVRDAGTFQAEGWLTRGRGEGTWTFQPSTSFSDGLRRRGIGEPNSKQQFELALAGFKFATLDRLLASGFERPSVDDLIAMIDHAVSDGYIQGLLGLGLRPNSARALILMRDRGVGSSYAATVVRIVPGTTADQLVAMREHGVGASFVEELARMGYHVSAADLIRLRDHGISTSFIERARSHGYTKLSVDELIRLRDIGF